MNLYQILWQRLKKMHINCLKTNGKKLGIKQSSAQITNLYSKDDLMKKQVVVVVNFPPKQIGSFMSECLITGFYNNHNQVILAIPDQPIENGALLA